MHAWPKPNCATRSTLEWTQTQQSLTRRVECAWTPVRNTVRVLMLVVHFCAFVFVYFCAFLWVFCVFFVHLFCVLLCILCTFCAFLRSFVHFLCTFVYLFCVRLCILCTFCAFLRSFCAFLCIFLCGTYWHGCPLTLSPSFGGMDIRQRCLPARAWPRLFQKQFHSRRSRKQTHTHTHTHTRCETCAKVSCERNETKRNGPQTKTKSRKRKQEEEEEERTTQTHKKTVVLYASYNFWRFLMDGGVDRSLQEQVLPM